MCAYEGTDSALIVDDGSDAEIKTRFEAAYRMRYSFLMEHKALLVEAVSVEVTGKSGEAATASFPHEARSGAPQAAETVQMYSGAKHHDTPVFVRATSSIPADRIPGPAIIAEKNATTIVEPGWQAEVTPLNHLVLTRVVPRPGGKTPSAPRPTR